MRKIIVLSMVSLDGVMQAPGAPGEDTSGGFRFGGWTAPYGDLTGDKIVREELDQKTDYLLGRKTFDIWEKYWPLHSDFWPQINLGKKYVLSSSRTESEWKNSVFIKNVEEIKKLKETDGPDIQVWGSSQLIQLLLKNNLVDELRLKTYPLTLGSGKKLFSQDIPAAAFKLTQSIVTETGIVIASYKLAGEVKTGEIKV